MSRSATEVLTDALQHLEALQDYAARGLDDQLVVDAICMRLSAAIEVLAGLDSDVRDRLFGEDWPLMWGMRNRIAHLGAIALRAISRLRMRDSVDSDLDRGCRCDRHCRTC